MWRFPSVFYGLINRSHSMKEDRREKLKVAAARLRSTMDEDFQCLGADEMMRFIRGDDEPPKPAPAPHRTR